MGNSEQDHGPKNLDHHQNPFTSLKNKVVEAIQQRTKRIEDIRRDIQKNNGIK